AIDFEVAAQAADPAAAVQVVAARVAEIRSLLAEVGGEGASVEVRDTRKEIKKRDGNGEPNVMTYEIRCGVKIMVRDLTKWKAIVAPLLDKPNLDGFMAAFDSTERTRIESELMVNAINEARRKAEVIAVAFGRKAGAVSAVSSGELKNLSRSMNLSPSDFLARGRAREVVARDELLSTSAQKLSQAVDVIFRIK
ncbi:MAG: SIMPL domain-containing protein, partial [Bdellovibrionales bacterium]|nr:SIMPL domain-containing protein [Massilia sp.]